MITRRELLCRSYLGLGALPLFQLLGAEASPSTLADPLAPKPPHRKAKAKKCIFLFMEGGVSQMDTFEYKPALWKFAGKQMPKAELRPIPSIWGHMAPFGVNPPDNEFIDGALKELLTK